MKAFHGSDETKQLYLERVRAYAAADELIHGTYWENGRGRGVGCTLHSVDHRAYESELGIPAVLAHLEDRIFDGLPPDRAKLWPEQFLSSIGVGADLSGIWPQFAVWLLTDPEHGVIRFADDRSAPIITAIADWYRGPMTDLDEIRRLSSDAFTVYAAAADAAYADAADAAYADAADAADAVYVAYAAAAYTAQADKLLSLLAADAADAGASYTAQADKLLSLMREWEE